MHSNVFRTVAAAAAAAAVVVLAPGSAQAAAAPCNFGDRPKPAGISCTTTTDSSGSKVTVIKSGNGSTLRAVFYDSWTTYKGDRIVYYGGGNCSASTSDTDFKLSSLPDDWNDKISSVADFAACDVNLFQDVDFKKTSTGYVNYGNGKHLSLTKRSWVSSFRIS